MVSGVVFIYFYLIMNKVGNLFKLLREICIFSVNLKLEKSIFVLPVTTRNQLVETGMKILFMGTLFRCQ